MHLVFIHDCLMISLKAKRAYYILCYSAGCLSEISPRYPSWKHSSVWTFRGMPHGESSLSNAILCYDDSSRRTHPSKSKRPEIIDVQLERDSYKQNLRKWLWFLLLVYFAIIAIIISIKNFQIANNKTNRILNIN